MLAVLAALTTGLFFGAVDRWLTHGPTWSFDVSNVAALWLAAAFLAGMASRTRWRGMICGFLVLMAALFGYYGTMFVIEHVTPVSYLFQRASPWIAATIVVGPAFGWLGNAWAKERARLAAVTLGAAFVIDGLAYIAIDGAADHTNVAVHVATALTGLAIGTTLLLWRRKGGPSVSPITVST